MRLISPLTMHSSNFLPFSLLQWVFFQTSVLLHFHFFKAAFTLSGIWSTSLWTCSHQYGSLWRFTFSPSLTFLHWSNSSKSHSDLAYFAVHNFAHSSTSFSFLFSSQNCLLLIEKLSMYQHVWLPGGEWWAPPSIMVLHNGPAGIPTLWDTRGIPL